MPSFREPNPSAWWLKSMPPLMGPALCTSYVQCLLSWTNHSLHDKNHCRPLWGQLHSVRDCGQCLPYWDQILHFIKPNFLKVKILFTVVDSGCLAVLSFCLRKPCVQYFPVNFVLWLRKYTSYSFNLQTCIRWVVAESYSRKLVWKFQQVVRQLLLVLIKYS
jgi:hypothetical protein